jgi:hypothetical protein
MLDDTIRSLFQALNKAYMQRNFNAIDPFLLGQYGGNIIAWADNVFTYWIRETSELPPYGNGKKRLWFVNAIDTPHCQIPFDARIVHLGHNRFTTDSALYEIHEFKLSPWSSHTKEKDLIEFIRQISDKARIILFHNFPKRLRKFIKLNNLDATALDSEGFVIK